ncbi:APC family permease [Georgenia wangjunii]|uniref:APC family permease n=1 Tax=Georgenia wangjunii TaxID=3117730 RepID=UPI002F26D692
MATASNPSTPRTEPTEGSGGDETRLKRSITGPLLFVFILGDVLGAGVYALTGVLAGEAGGAMWIPILVALAMALLTAASYAELVTKYPRAGGAAVFAQRAFKSPVVSFLVGFSMLAAGVVSAAGLAIAFAGDYLATFVPVPTAVAAPVFLVLVALLNARGIKESMRSNLVMTIIETSGLVLVIVLVGIALGGGAGEPSRIMEFPDGVPAGSAILAAAVIAFYSFVGFETSANIAEEVRDVRRVYPRALFGALLACGVVYVLVAMASAAMLPPDELSGTSGPLLAVVEATGAGLPPWVFSAIALVAVANGSLLTMIMASRLTFGMAEQGLLPPVFARVLPRRRTPWVAIVATTAVAMVLTIVGNLATLAETVVLLLLLVFISTNAAVLVLRKDRVDQAHFRTPVVLPVLALVSCVVLLIQQSATVWLFSGVLLVVGAVLYVVSTQPWRTKQDGAGRPDDARTDDVHP